MKEQELKILSTYFPEKAVTQISLWIPYHKILLSITKPQKSRYGDFTTKPIKGMWQIRINGSLSKYAFLITFVHELAHLIAQQKYGRLLQAHGVEWKKEFRVLMGLLPLSDIFPSDIYNALLDYLKNPKASHDRHPELYMALAVYNPDYKKLLEENHTPIETIGVGNKFIYKQREFKIIEQRRKLFTCQCIENLKLYNFQPQVLVKKS